VTEDEEEDICSYLMAVRKMRAYWKLKEEALERTLWRTGIGRGYGPLVRQTVE
jgi:hypothetical protein